jgi:hypothetical protein
LVPDVLSPHSRSAYRFGQDDTWEALRFNDGETNRTIMSMNSPANHHYSDRVHPPIPTGRRIASLFALGAAVLLTAGAAQAAPTVITKNTAGAQSFTPPSGVTLVQVECWGGGGAGGYGERAASGGTTSLGGGGAGGAYARSAAVPVTHPTAYNFTIGAQATSSTTEGGRANGADTTFTGDSSVVVTAKGGQGGQSKVNSGVGLKGTGNLTGCVGDAGAIFAGGNGADAVSSTFSSGGGGGGGAGNANAGGPAPTPTTSSAAGGTGGGAGGGNGGAGRYQNQGSGVGVDGSNPGGGGGGARANTAGNQLSGGKGGLGQVLITYYALPTTQASAVGFSGVSGNSMSISWTRGNGDGCIVLVKAGSAVDSNPVNGSAYTANSTFGGGTQIGTGNYVVYQGAGTSVSISGLSAGQTYYVAVYEVNGAGTAISTVMTALPATGNQTTTSALPPVLASPAKSAITDTTATLGATMTQDNGNAVTEYGVVWGTSANPTTANNKVQAGTSIANGTAFTAGVSSLPAGTTIHYRGYAINADGTGYSPNDSFLTLATPPTSQASGVGFASVSFSTMTVNWTRGDGSQCIVLVKQGSAVNANPVGGTTYTANANFGSGSQIGIGNYVAYLGTGTSVALTGLTPGETYHVAVYELNGSGGAQNYLTTSPATGNQTMQTPAIGATTQFRSKSSGNWNVAGTWEISNDSGATWYSVFSGFASGSTPGSTHVVYVQSSHTVTLTQNEACGDLRYCRGSGTSGTTAPAGIGLADYTLTIHGQLIAYNANVGTTPGTPSGNNLANYPFTQTSSSAKVSIAGTTRTLTPASSWGSLVSAPGTGVFPLSIDLQDANQTVTLASGMKVSSCTVNTGTFDLAGQAFRLDTGTGGQGDLTVNSGCRVKAAASPQFGRTGTAGANNAAGKLWVKSGAVLELSAATPTSEMTSYQLDGTVDYSRGTAQTLLGLPASADPAAVQAGNGTYPYASVILQGGGAKTLAANTTVNGTLTLGGTASLALNAFTLTYGGSATLKYAGTAQQTTAASEFPASGGAPNLEIANAAGVKLDAGKTITGTLTVNAGANLDFNTNVLTVGATSLSGSGSLTLQVNKTGPNTFTGSKLTQTAGTLSYGGTLTVTASGSALQSGDVIPIFVSSGGFGGGFSSVSPPAQTGLSANTSQFTGGTGGNISYDCDGSFTISTTSLANGTYGAAYNQTVTAAGATSFGATGLPPGLSINNSGAISGTPTAAGSSSVTINATNAVGCTATTIIGLNINPVSTFVGASSTKNPSGYKDTVSYMATLPADATGSVVFSSTNGAFSTNAVSSGSATSLSITNLPRGTNVITVAYLGDGNYLGSSTNLEQIVTNHPPVAVDATYYRAKGLSLKIALTNLLANVTDADGDTNTLLSVGTGLTNATIMTDSAYVYYLPGTGAGSNDNDVVSYTVGDGFGGTATANILVDVYSAAGPAQMSLSTNGVVNIMFYGIPNYTYIVQTTTNLSVPWWTLITNTAGTNGMWQFTDPNATNAQQYYRSSQP